MEKTMKLSKFKEDSPLITSIYKHFHNELEALIIRYLFKQNNKNAIAITEFCITNKVRNPIIIKDICKIFYNQNNFIHFYKMIKQMSKIPEKIPIINKLRKLLVKSKSIRDIDNFLVEMNLELKDSFKEKFLQFILEKKKT